MKKINGILIGAIAMFGTSTALAQADAPANPPASSEAQTPGQPAGAEAQNQTQVTITQQDIDNFAKAAIEMEKIQANASLDDSQKQTAMTAAVEKSDLDTYMFNTIAKASETNKELQQRVQLAIVQHQQK
jgi:hypothetical protein